MPSLLIGEKLKSKYDKNYFVVIRFIASGAQGEVYEVTDKKNRTFALKWYFKHSATDHQKRQIERLVDRGSPDGRFLWPVELVVRNDTFGYIMRLRPSTYKGIVDLMKRKAVPTFRTLCSVGINLSEAFRSLHSSGLCYRDVSFNNLFFDPSDGNVMICDTDNVTVNMDTHGGIIGTPRFIAPEIVTQRKAPSTYTDLHSIAVLLFYLFMSHHPLEGAIEAEIACLDMTAMSEIYSYNPIFIWDEENTSNRPVGGYQDNAIIFWNIYPQFIRDLFHRTFTKGLFDINHRVVELLWIDAFTRLKDSIVNCEDCLCENFADFSRPRNCWNCNSPIV
ncbi:MAG: hypothetical protein FWB96_06715 [Defluviitaleaceae bacterium]|nr:hypothetical protein [Defluviitaleaceae bacterium]MCL2262614.1 hypothetical protein [Defluviitaleaceae bacterium]